MYDELGDTANALANYNMALNLVRDAQAMNNKGTILFNRKQYGPAGDLFADAEKLNGTPAMPTRIKPWKLLRHHRSL